MEQDIPPTESSGSLGALSLSEDDICDDDALQGDTWIEELECALLADCDPATLKKICEGKRIPATLRPDYWRILLALNDADGRVKLTNEYDLPNQHELRRDCELLVADISATLATEPLSDADKLKLKSDFESTLTTYVKARPELNYVSGNGWTDILKVLYNLQLSDTQMYQMFFRIVDRYIPRDLSPTRTVDSGAPRPESSANTNDASGRKQKSEISSKQQQQQQQQQPSEKSVQAYHLLRLLIQYHDPELCSILDSRNVTPNLYVKDWFCSLFARSCSPKLALHIWDMHFKIADPFLIFFAAIVMVANASDELKNGNLNKKDMLNVLKKMPSQLEEDDVEDLYYLVSNHYTNSTPRSIRSYSHLFFMDTFGATYSGNESPEDGSPTLVDLKTCHLTNSLDLSQYLCLPIVPAEIFALDTAQQRSNRTQSMSTPSSTLRYFLVDCRPAEQYNAGHLTKAFHLDCSLMLREPSSFATAVQALLEIQRQVVASKSNTGGQHLCFIGSGQEEEDRYVNMVVASFLQKYQKYVSIVFGGFDAIHDYVQTKSELKESFSKYIVDHNEELCKTCCSKSPDAYERFKAHQAAVARTQQQQQQQQASSGFSSAQSLFATTTSFFKSDKGGSSALSKFTSSNPQATVTAQQIAQSGASMLDKFTTAFVSKSNVIKDRLVGSLNTTAIPAPGLASSPVGSPNSARSHVSSQDKLGPRYTGGSSAYGDSDGLTRGLASMRQRVGSLLQSQDDDIIEEPCQEIQIDQWQRENEIVAIYKCAQIKGTLKYPGYIGLNRTHLWILRGIPHNKGFASIAAKRPLDMIVQITSKRRQPDFIIFRYGYANSGNKSTSASPESQSPDLPVKGHQATENKESDPANDKTTNQSNSNDDSASSAIIKPAAHKGLPTIIASDHLHIPEAFEVIRLIKREIVRIMDESSRKTSCCSSTDKESGDAAKMTECDAATTSANEPNVSDVQKEQEKGPEEEPENEPENEPAAKPVESKQEASDDTATK
uniref:TBC1 domain family member 23 n=1 Tax=Aceria tosichella TaxID=561515 RepID=A0A6G1S703_9ACAR